jgi:kynurenine formamidase
MPDLIDLSVPLESGPSERVPVTVRRIAHRQGGEEMERIFGVPLEHLGGLGWASEELTLISHAGTHMDAPWHYSPTSNGEPARTIDEIPLEWCFASAVVLDLRFKGHGGIANVADLEKALCRIGHRLRPGEIVLLHTGASEFWGTPDYPECGVGLVAESTLWLCEQGIRVIGTDAWSLDPPFGVMRRQFAETSDARVIWSAHFAGRKREYCQLEKLANLNLLPPDGFYVACFPVKIAKGSAGWVRAVALLNVDQGRIE